MNYLTPAVPLKFCNKTSIRANRLWVFGVGAGRGNRCIPWMVREAAEPPPCCGGTEVTLDTALATCPRS